MPRKDGFDPDRAIFWGQPNFVPLLEPRVAVPQGRSPSR